MKISNLSKKVFSDPVYFMAFGFGSGLLPKAPGTWGTLVGILIYFLMMNLSSGIYLFVTILAFLLGVYVSEKVTQDLGTHDYGGIVWDEVVGYLLTMFMVPHSLIWIVLGFILFRVFDIWKPQPIGWVDERVKGGLGIMLDDVLAAIPAWLLLHALVFIF